MPSALVEACMPPSPPVPTSGEPVRPATASAEGTRDVRFGPDIISPTEAPLGICRAGPLAFVEEGAVEIPRVEVPQHEDAERVVLGSMMLNPGCIEAVTDRLTTGSFYRAGKTPSMNLALGPIRERDAEAHARYLDQMAIWRDTPARERGQVDRPVDPTRLVRDRIAAEQARPGLWAGSR